MTDASRATSMSFVHLGTPDKRLAGPQYCSTPVRSCCAQDDGEASESDVSTFLSTLDEFVERCESFLVPHQSAPSDHDATVIHAPVTVPLDSAADAETDLEHTCSIQCDCSFGKEGVDHGEVVAETENDFSDENECADTCCSEPCGSYSQSAVYCSGQVSHGEQGCANYYQNLVCKQDCDTCDCRYQEPGPRSRDLEERNFQHASNEMVKKCTHVPLSFIGGYSFNSGAQTEGEQYKQHDESFDKSCGCHNEPKMTGVDEFDYQKQRNYGNYGKGDEAFYPEECPKAHYRKEWEKHSNYFSIGHHQENVDLVTHKSEENAGSVSGGRNELEQYDDHFSKTYELKNSLAVDKKWEKANHMSCASSAFSSNHHELKGRAVQQYTVSFKDSCEMEDAFELGEHQELEEAHLKQYQESFSSSRQRDGGHRSGNCLEGIYSKRLGRHPDHSKSLFPFQELSTSADNTKHSRRVSCTNSNPTLTHPCNLSNQELKKKGGPHVTSFQCIHATDNGSTFNRQEEEADSKCSLQSFTSGCQRKDSFTPEAYLETAYKKDLYLDPNICDGTFAPLNAWTSTENKESTAASLNYRVMGAGKQLCASSLSSSCIMEDASTFKQCKEKLVEPEQETRNDFCVSGFKGSCITDDASALKQHEEESVDPEQEARNELCVSSFDCSCVIEDAFVFKQRQEEPVEPAHKPDSQSFGYTSHDGHISEKCLKELHEKELNQHLNHEKFECNFLPGSGHKSNFGVCIPFSVSSGCNSDQLMRLSEHQAQIPSCSYATSERSPLCAVCYDDMSSCITIDSVKKGVLECCRNLSPSEKKIVENEGSAADGNVCSPDLVAPDQGKTCKEGNLQPWLQEANLNSPAYFTGIVQVIPDDPTVVSPTCHKAVHTKSISHKTDDELGSALPDVLNDTADPLHDGEPGLLKDVLGCDSVINRERRAIAVSEGILEPEVASVEKGGFKKAAEDNTVNAGACIVESDPTTSSGICETSVLSDSTDSHDTTLVAVSVRNAASSTPRHDQSSPSHSIMSEDVLDIRVEIDEDDTFVAEVESPITSAEKSKRHQKAHVQTPKVEPVKSPVASKAKTKPIKEVEAEAESSPKDVHTGDTSPSSVPPFLEHCKVEACSSENEDMRKKINNIRRQRGEQPELPHLDVQASYSRTADDQERQEPNSEETKRRAPFMSGNPEENMDNENPDWEAVRRLTTEEERYQAVKKVWHNSRVPDPHHELSSYHYRRNLLGLKQSNTPARKRCKRKTSHDPSSEYSEPAKRQRFDTDIIDLKLRELERKKEKDVTRAQNTFRYDMDMLHRGLRNEAQSLRYRGRSECSRYSGDPLHRRAQTAPWDFHYYQVQERKIHEQFMANAQSINNTYSARANKLLSARDEVRRFDAFYAGLQGSDPRLLSEQQIKENLKLEELLGHFNVVYDAAKN